MCQDEVRKARDQLESDTGFQRPKERLLLHLGESRKISENVGPADWGVWLCRTQKRLKILNELLGSVFTVLQESQVPETLGKV